MFVRVNDTRLYFDVLNPQLVLEADAILEKPALVCLHGGPGGDHLSLRPHLDRLSAVSQVIYLDQRGGGRSDPGDPADWTLNRWADDVAAVCDALGIDRPIVLGVSGGAMVTQAFLARHPGRARAAVLVNACARLDRETLIAGFEALGGPPAGAAARAMYTRASPEDVPAFFRHCLPHYARKGGAGISPHPGSTFNFAVSQHFFREGGEAFRYDHRRDLGSVTCPVLVIAGAHDPVTRLEWALEVADALPEALGETLILEDASHLVLSDAPERVFAGIEAFLARL